MTEQEDISSCYFTTEETWSRYISYFAHSSLYLLACENIRSSWLLVARDVSRGGTSATQRQKLHTDDVKSVQNLVRSADWSTE